jgi:hypothetical protein
MSKPIPDKAEVAIDYPDKFYVGTFERSSRFEAHLDEKGVALTLERTGAPDTRKSVYLHINHALFAEILRDLAATANVVPVDDVAHRAALAEAAGMLHHALAQNGKTRAEASARRPRKGAHG